MKCRCQVPDHMTCILFCVFSCSYNGLKQVSTLKRRKCRKNDKLNNILLIILVITKGCGVRGQLSKVKTLLLHHYALHKFHMKDSQTRVIRLRVIESLKACDQIAFFEFHSFLVEV